MFKPITDIDGRNLQIGDTIIYAMKVGHSPALRRAKVIGLWYALDTQEGYGQIKIRTEQKLTSDGLSVARKSVTTWIKARPSTLLHVSVGAAPMYIVHSSHGDLHLDSTGKVVGWFVRTDDVDPEIPKIERFDLDEYKKHYGKLDSEYDILDLGCWIDGKYEEPEHQWRADILKGI